MSQFTRFCLPKLDFPTVAATGDVFTIWAKRNGVNWPQVSSKSAAKFAIAQIP
jgi:hypothetical protein